MIRVWHHGLIFYGQTYRQQKTPHFKFVVSTAFILVEDFNECIVLFQIGIVNKMNTSVHNLIRHLVHGELFVDVVRAALYAKQLVRLVLNYPVHHW